MLMMMMIRMILGVACPYMQVNPIISRCTSLIFMLTEYLVYCCYDHNRNPNNSTEIIWLGDFSTDYVSIHQDLSDDFFQSVLCKQCQNCQRCQQCRQVKIQNSLYFLMDRNTLKFAFQSLILSQSRIIFHSYIYVMVMLWYLCTNVYLIIMR